ncbi:MAG: hypothetical protein KAS62_04885, partial [Candidatus Delongbacteria bacterium]|nr:hypothetical protein [Candidatus Delongbacteria bacterium]
MIIMIPVIIYFSKWYYSRSGLGKSKKIFLMVLRAVILFQLLLVLFNPVLSINNTKVIKVHNLVLFDNSLSIIQNDSIESVSITSLFGTIAKYDEFTIYQFGDSIRPINNLLRLDFKDNFSKINDLSNFDNLKYDFFKNEYENVFIITDGNFTDYRNTSLSLGIPINFIHTQNKSEETDIFIKDINYDDIIDPSIENDYEITVGITGNSSNSNFELLVRENDRIVKKIIEKVPENGSFKRIPVSLKTNDTTLKTTEFTISKLTNEKNLYNNSRNIFQKVSNKQKNILVVYGNPSLDLKFFLDILKKHNISYLIHSSNDKTFSIKNNNFDLVILYSYPNRKRNKQLDSLINNFDSKLIFITEKTERNKLNALADLRLDNLKYIYRKGFVLNNKDNLNSYLYSFDDGFINLNELPAIEYDAGFIPSEKLYYPILDIKSDKLSHGAYQAYNSDRKTTLINMKYFWKAFSVFEKNTTNSELEKFFLNVIEHLSIDKTSDNIKISPTKLIFVSGEKIIFEGKIFDENFRPLKNEVIKLSIIENEAESEFVYSNGKYSAMLDIADPGLYTAKISLYKDNKKFISVKKEFKIIENNLELSTLGANLELMKDIADKTNGILIPLSEADKYFDTIKGKKKVIVENLKINIVKN